MTASEVIDLPFVSPLAINRRRIPKQVSK